MLKVRTIYKGEYIKYKDYNPIKFNKSDIELIYKIHENYSENIIPFYYKYNNKTYRIYKTNHSIQICFNHKELKSINIEISLRFNFVTYNIDCNHKRFIDEKIKILNKELTSFNKYKSILLFQILNKMNNIKENFNSSRYTNTYEDKKS